MTTDMPSKINTAKLMLQVLGWLLIAFGAFFMLMFFGAGAIFRAAGEEGAAVGTAVFGVLGLGIGGVAVALGIFHLFTARGIVERKSWAKVSAIVLAVLSVMNIPIGTVLAVFIFIGMFSDDANAWFVEA